MKVSFLGLGIMGSRMAANLLKNGIDLTVWNRSLAVTKDLEKQGAKVAQSAADCVENADLVFTMLSTPAVVEEVALGKNGFVKQMKSNAIWADCSTVNPSFSKAINEKITDYNIRFAATPVAGSKNQAAEAVLVFFCGGDETVFEEIKPIIDHMSKAALHLGDVSMGANLKMLVNSMLGQSMVVFAENVALGEKMGLDKEFLLNFLPKLPVIAPFVGTKTDNIKNGNYPVEFPLEWLLKDMHLVMQSAYENEMPQVMASAAKEVFARAQAKGLAREDFSAVYEVVKK